MSQQLPTTPPTMVLVVDDELLMRMEAVTAFEEAGFEVLEAGHAAEALNHLNERAHRVMALFTDIQMPGRMDGVALVHETRRRWPWIHLLVASGRVGPLGTALPPRARFLSKPYLSDDAVRHVREMLEAAKAA